MSGIALIAVVLWAGLVLLVNQRPPTMLHQAVFLATWGLAIACTLTPVSYRLNARLTNPVNGHRVMPRALRQGTLLGLLATAVMALRFLRLLDPVMGLILLLAFVLVELLLWLRES